MDSDDTMTPSNQSHRNNAPILLVEDDTISLSIIRAFLNSIGVVSDDAMDGLDAFNKIVKKPYAAVLIDIEMPIMNGIQTTAIIRRLGQYEQHRHLSTLPIIALTAAQDQETIEACQAAGMTDVLYKPINPEQLLNRLSAYITTTNTRSAKTAHDSAIQANNSNHSEEIQRLTMLNTQEAIARIGGSEATYRRQLARFEKNHRDAVQTLTHHLITGNHLAAAHYCHALRGVLSNLGDTLISSKLREIEHNIKTKQPIRQETLNTISYKIKELLDKITQLAPITIVTPFETNIAQLTHLKAQLAHALANDISHATPIVEQLTAALKNSILYPKILRIAMDIEIFNIDDAIDTLETLDLRDLDNGNASTQ